MNGRKLSSCHFLEEKDEETPEITTIQFKETRQINSQYIPVRLMTQFKEYPAVYNDKDEDTAKANFKSAFDQKARQKFVVELHNQEEAII